MTPTFYIIDGHGYSYQAFYALSGLSAPDGIATNAIFGIARLVEKILKMNPDYFAFCFDPPSPCFRKEIYRPYKETRKPMPEEMRTQLPIIKELLAAYRITVVESPGYEADDVMATLARRAAGEGIQVYLCTIDKDVQQIVSEHINIYDPKKNEFVGPKEVKNRFKVEVQQLPDYFALVGDPIDNIPGVKGIGPKTAEGLLQKWQSLEEIYRHLNEVTPAKARRLLSEYKDTAFLSRKLFLVEDQVNIPLDLSDFRVKHANTEALRAIFQRLGFQSLLARLAAEAREVNPWMISSRDDLLRLIALLKKQEFIVVEPNATEDKLWESTLQELCFAWKEDEAAFIALSPENLQEFTSFLLPILQGGVPKAAYNLKNVYRVLYRHGIVLAPLAFDAVVAGYLLTPSLKGFSLDDLSLQYLGESSAKISLAADAMERSRHFCARACQIYRLVKRLDLELTQAGLKSLFSEIELPTIPTLVEMELSGISLDKSVLAQISGQLRDKIQELEGRVYESAGEKFNIGSTQQMGEVLFEKLKLPRGRKTKTGYSTDSEVLEDLAVQHPFPAMVIEHRHLSKLLNTYVEALPTFIHPKTGRIHTVFHQTGTITGRISSSDPNLQNIPIRTEVGSQVRRAFVASPGQLLLTADYSQIELRILAHFSQDPRLIKAFQDDMDIHAAVAANLFSVSPEKVTPDQRRVAKSVNFGIIYGQTPYGLSKELRISVKEAKKFILAYFDHYARVKEFLEEIIAEAREKKYVVTLMKRRRYLPDINSAKQVARKFAERTAVNSVMQGSAADIIKKAMNAVYARRNEEMLPFKILLQIHDELMIESPKQNVKAVADLLRTEMLRGFQLSVPLKVKIAVGENWLDMQPVTTL